MTMAHFFLIKGVPDSFTRDDHGILFPHCGCLIPDIFLNSLCIASMRKGWSTQHSLVVAWLAHLLLLC